MIGPDERDTRIVSAMKYPLILMLIGVTGMVIAIAVQENKEHRAIEQLPGSLTIKGDTLTDGHPLWIGMKIDERARTMRLTCTPPFLMNTWRVTNNTVEVSCDEPEYEIGVKPR